jgi:hypothetical protein
MSHDINKHPDPLPPFDDAAREREWLAQENAMRRERLQLDPHHDDARTQRYRLLAHALRRPTQEDLDGLPADFAQQLANQLGPVRKPFRAPVEAVLMIALCAALLVSAAIFAMPYLSAAWQRLLVSAQTAPTSWSMLLGLIACVALTDLFGHWSPTARKR